MLNVASVDLVDDIRNLLYTMQDLQTVECSMVQEVEKPEEFAIFEFKNEGVRAQAEEPKQQPKIENVVSDQKILTLQTERILANVEEFSPMTAQFVQNTQESKGEYLIEDTLGKLSPD